MWKILKNITLFTVVLIITLISLDLFVKYAGISQFLIYNYDKHLGRIFIPDAEYIMTTEGFAMGSINQYGYIGPGYSKEKTPGKLRIALLGDSYIEGFQQFDRNHFRAVMERELKNKYGIDAEILNFGKFGYNLSDMFAFNKNFVSQFDPDLTLFFFSEEDLSDTTSQSLMPHPYLESDSIVIQYSEIVKSNRPWFIDRIELSKISPTVMMIRNGMTLHGKGETPRILLGKFNDLLFKKIIIEQNANEKVLRPIAKLNKRILEDLAKKDGNILIYRGHDELPPVLKDSIKKTGVRYISVVEIFKKGKQDGIPLYFIDQNGNDGHWNIKAHELIGLYLAGWIAANSLL